uniref:Uncharacterized protein n=1 Tax=Aplanochytrium stocchinoi TaxID=215587 RepID=A0A7S3PPY9_9STRA|mmetsp:Transcript_4904/g.6204  ORF Transcript_4904/g.6204 Transcript_4904/m.6204 type:complete len:127 (-) Transcript_4904:363-743(-)
MYLSKKDTDDFLYSITSNIKSNSFLAMDQLWQVPENEQWKYHGLRIGSKAAKNRGEPFSNGIPIPTSKASAESWFSHHGFSIIQHVQMNTSETKQMYTTISDGHIIGRSFEAENYFLLQVENGASI